MFFSFGVAFVEHFLEVQKEAILIFEQLIAERVEVSLDQAAPVVAEFLCLFAEINEFSEYVLDLGPDAVHKEDVLFYLCAVCAFPPFVSKVLQVRLLIFGVYPAELAHLGQHVTHQDIILSGLLHVYVSHDFEALSHPSAFQQELLYPVRHQAHICQLVPLHPRRPFFLKLVLNEL